MRGEEGGDGLATGGWVVGKLVERELGWLGRIEEVPEGIVHGMRKAVARDVRVGRERDVRGVAWRWSGGGHRNTSLGSDGGQPHARQPLGHPRGPLIDGLAPLHHAEAVAPLGENMQLRGQIEPLVGQIEHRRFGGV